MNVKGVAQSSLKRKLLVFSILSMTYLAIVCAFAWAYYEIYKREPKSFFVDKALDGYLGQEELYKLLEDLAPAIIAAKDDQTLRSDVPDLYEEMVKAEEQRKKKQIPANYTLPYRLNFGDFLFFSTALGNGDIRPLSRLVRWMIAIQNIILILYGAFFVNLVFSWFQRKQSDVVGKNSSLKKLNDVCLEDILKITIPKSVAENIIKARPFSSVTDLVNRVDKVGPKRLASILDNFEI
jgi:hypothetical protein